MKSYRQIFGSMALDFLKKEKVSKETIFQRFFPNKTFQKIKFPEIFSQLKTLSANETVV